MLEALGVEEVDAAARRGSGVGLEEAVKLGSDTLRAATAALS